MGRLDERLGMLTLTKDCRRGFAIGLEEDPITRNLDCRLYTGKPGLVALQLERIQRSLCPGIEALRPAPDKLLVFEDWNDQVPEWLVDAVLGFNEYSLGFEAVKYRIPGLFVPGAEYDLSTDRTIVFEPLPHSSCPCSVIHFYAEKLSASDSRYQFCELDGNLVGMVSSSVGSDYAQGIVHEAVRNYTKRRPDIRIRYEFTGSASAHTVKKGCKLRIPDCFVLPKHEYRAILDRPNVAGKILPPKIRAAVVVELLSASDDLPATMKKCREYITSDHCTDTVILLADVYSVKHAKKFDEVHTFKLIGGKVEYELLNKPEYVDLGPGLPDCRVYFCFTLNKFEHGDLYTDLSDDEILQLLCDAACADNLDDVKKFTCGLPCLNIRDPKGRLALVEACRVGNSDMVRWLLDEGADKDLKDARGFWPALVAHGPVLQQVASTAPICIEDFNKALDAKDDELVRALLQAGADPCEADAAGRVPLIEAVRSMVPLDTFKVLVDNAKDVNIEDKDGLTALRCAKKRARGYEEVLLKAQRRYSGTGSFTHQ